MAATPEIHSLTAALDRARQRYRSVRCPENKALWAVLEWDRSGVKTQVSGPLSYSAMNRLKNAHQAAHVLLLLGMPETLKEDARDRAYRLDLPTLETVRELMEVYQVGIPEKKRHTLVLNSRRNPRVFP